MTINASETPLAAPLGYADAASRLSTSGRPQPLGAEYARGVSEPSVRVEISDLAKEALRASAERTASLEAAATASKTRNAREIPLSTLDQTQIATGAQDQMAKAERNADRVDRNSSADAPPIDMAPKSSILPEAGPSLRRKLELQDTDAGLETPLQPSVAKAAPSAKSLEPAPAILSSGVTATYAMDAFQRAGQGAVTRSEF